MPAPINPPPITTNSSIFLDITFEDEKLRNPTKKQYINLTVANACPLLFVSLISGYECHIFDILYLLLTYSDRISWFKQKGSHFKVVTFVRIFELPQVDQ